MDGEGKVGAGDRETEGGSVEGEGSKGGAGGFETILPVTVARGCPEGDEGRPCLRGGSAGGCLEMGVISSRKDCTAWGGCQGGRGVHSGRRLVPLSRLR